MNFDLVRPCGECPFRNDRRGFLRPERAEEIAESVLNGDTFACHKTLGGKLDDDGNLQVLIDSQMCAGARAFQHRHGVTSQMERICGRLNYHYAELAPDLPVFDGVDEFVAAQLF